MDPDTIAGLERIRHLEVLLARLPVTGERHRQCAIAIRMAASLYGDSRPIGYVSRQVDAKLTRERTRRGSRATRADVFNRIVERRAAGKASFLEQQRAAALD